MVRKSCILKVLLTCCCIALLCPGAHSQKVGLVLSGGGAKGVAHIGVIKALEEAGIPIHYITGTSMGAIIGGLYASGYSPEDMMAIINSPDFPNWVNGNIDDKYIYFFKNPEPDAGWISFNFNVDSIVLPSIIPANIISPLQLDFAFMEFFSGAAANARYQFDSLFIPFRCIASDISVNEPVVMRSGDLGSAIRASMTFPFYFKPIRIDGKLLFDGGMYNNFPVDVMMKDFHPDVVIGSQAASNYPPPEDNNALSQLQSMLMVKTDYSMIPGKSVLLTPVLPKLGITDFSYSAELIDSGYYSTVRKIPEIRKLIKDSIPKSEIESRRLLFRSNEPPPKVDSIIISNLNRKQSNYLTKILVQKKSSFTLDQLKSQYFKVISDDKIESIFPTLHYDDQEKEYHLMLQVEKEKNTSVSVGGNISSKPINSAFFGIKYKYLGNQAITLTANTYIGRYYSSAQMSARFDFPSKVPYYFDSHFSFNQWDYFKTKTYFFEDKSPSYLVKNDNHIEADLGFPIGNQGKVLMGLNASHLRNDFYQTNYFTRKDTSDKSYFDVINPFVKFEINTLNKKEYANKGVYLDMEFRYFQGNESYEPGSTSVKKPGIKYKQHHRYINYHFSYQNYFKHFKPVSLGWYTEMNLSNMPFFQNYTATILMSPSFEVIPESRTLFIPHFRANTFFATGLQSILNLSGNLDFRIEGYIFQPYKEYLQTEKQQAIYGPTFDKRYLMASAVLVLHNPFAPISLSLNYFEKADQPYSVIFNIGYILFNK